MPSFRELEKKFGEIAAQAILENLERFEGIRGCTSIPLEQRWMALMSEEQMAA